MQIKNENGMYGVHIGDQGGIQWEETHRVESERLRIASVVREGEVQDEDGTFITNAPTIALEIEKGLPGTGIINIMNGRWDRLENEPGSTERMILEGLLAQVAEDGRISEGGKRAGICEGKERWNGATGEPLDSRIVTNAREEEMEEVRKHKVYIMVPIDDCWGEMGKTFIKTRWIDINRGDKVNPE